jgi:flagellar biosynthesis/type III secretory pathway protein FliH
MDHWSLADFNPLNNRARVLAVESIEIQLKSTDSLRPNEELVQQILSRQDELSQFLQEDEPGIEKVTVEPEAGFPTGLEVFAITVAITFATAFAKAFAEGAGKETGKAIGEEVGKRLGARVRLWIRREFPDVVVEEDEKPRKS